MRHSLELPWSRLPVGGIVRYARSVYALLGNRRKFERVPFSGTIYVLQKGAVVDTTHVCSCVDVSKRGIAIECPETIPINAYVELCSEEAGHGRLALVRSCAPIGGQYRVGLEFVAKPE